MLATSQRVTGMTPAASWPFLKLSIHPEVPKVELHEAVWQVRSDILRELVFLVNAPQLRCHFGSTDLTFKGYNDLQWCCGGGRAREEHSFPYYPQRSVCFLSWRKRIQTAKPQNKDCEVTCQSLSVLSVVRQVLSTCLCLKLDTLALHHFLGKSIEHTVRGKNQTATFLPPSAGSIDSISIFMSVKAHSWPWDGNLTK